MESAGSLRNVRFSNRPIGVKRFQVSPRFVLASRARLTDNFHNKICHNQTHAPQQVRRDSIGIIRDLGDSTQAVSGCCLSDVGG